MKAFETEGRFWLPEKPNSPSFGRLEWDKDGGTKLSTYGTLVGEQKNLGVKIPVIHGIVENTPHSLGRAITLWNCHLTGRSTSSSDLIREFYRPQIALSGAHLSEERNAEFQATELRFCSMDSWARNYTGFNPNNIIKDRNLTFGFDYKAPPPLVFDCPSTKISIQTIASSKHRQRRYTLEESVVLEVVPFVQMRLSELNDLFVYPLQNFFTFAMNFPVSVERWINYLPEKTGETTQVDVSFSRYHSNSEKKVEGSGCQPLFYLNDVKNRLHDIFSKWLGAANQYRDSFNLYFGGRYNSLPFLDWRFQATLNSLTLFGRAQCPIPGKNAKLQEILTLVGPDNAHFLTQLLDTSLELNAETVLSKLLEEHGGEIEWLYGGPIGTFVTHTQNTIQYLLNRNLADLTTPPQGPELFFLTETLDWLFKLCLLKEIGFTRDERKKILDHNRSAQHIKGWSTRNLGN